MTDDTPTVPGLYFATRERTGERHPVVLVGSPNVRYVERFGTEQSLPVTHFVDWSGPITEQDAERLQEAVGLLEKILDMVNWCGYVRLQDKAREFVRKVKGEA